MILRQLRARRSTEVRRLRTELADEAARTVPVELGSAAREVQELKLALSAMVGVGRACAGCARCATGTAGRFDGGLCCSGATRNVFGPEEIAVLALTGTRPRDLTGSGASAGCAFRGQTGCVLEVDHRPSVCVHYLCNELLRELSESVDTRAIGAAQDRLAAAMVEFRRQYERVRGDRELAELLSEAPAADG